ncbi:DUF2497 domain-containing protein [Rhizobium glycinendophyticum]|uniref:DUF2497 domain-containing protein n=1 Tax=Rhizobium glycinendophyticum TaxID=2589807 RepID=A0A504UVY4_9HYPH|nr:DUF2497 domain-containing protein [Rhizobium glycinendophyticum]TPP10901.1 DUF2497 domain-containing protein [Rhizobium glycinendophyticum]
MAQPSVAREPSMEEILASIRRIIESNDPVSGETFASDVDDAEEAGRTPLVRETEVDFSYESVDFTPANDPGPATPVAPSQPRVETQPQHQPQPETTRSVSLADLAARVRSASERTERPVQQMVSVSAPMPSVSAPAAPTAGAQSEPAPRGDSPLMTARLAELRAPQLRPSISIEVHPAQATAPRAAADAPQPAPAVTETRQVAPAVPEQVAVRAPVQAPAIEPERRDIPQVRIETRTEEPRAPSFDAIAMHLAADRASEPATENLHTVSAGTDLTALVSAATVEQVSRSFSDLAAAIDGQERRSLDEMAEEMLRPMLKDWLDDNLPTLVERLVREEIERVARGPRR